MPIVRLEPTDLRLTVDPQRLGFVDTSEWVDQPLPWIGQDRAEAAARFGLAMDQPDYNLFVLGDLGSGRTSLMHQLVRDEAARRPVPPDLCYLHNFETPERPMALRLPPGEGRLLRQLMGDLAKSLQADIPKRLAASDVKAECEGLERIDKAREDQAFAELNAFAEARRFGVMREQGQLVFTRRDESGEPLTAGKAFVLSPQARAEIDTAEDALRTEITRFLEANRTAERALAERLAGIKRQAVGPLLDHALQDIRNRLRKQIKDTLKLGHYLDQVERHVLDNLELFLHTEDQEELRLAALTEVLTRLRVNVVVDHHESGGAPVILEENPLFRVLFGSIEYESDSDVLVTDFTRIRAGSLVRAHGGFLLLHLRDLLADPQVWEKLRRFLRSGRVQIEEPGMLYAPIAAVSLQPDPVDVDVKVVLIASVEEYYLVLEAAPDLARHFRCKVDFAESFMATPESHRATAVFVAHTCRRCGVPHFTAAAVAALVEASHRQAQDQHRQSAVFAQTEALLLESAVQARTRGAARVEAEDVHAAVRARTYRHDYAEQRMQETLTDGERLLTVTGRKVGSLNGLTVVDLGDHAFGFPVHVTACTHAGEEGLVNIEREVELSGPIHDKGVLILQSHLSSLFGHLAPLALDASVVFEQEYSGVEGDSASCAEFYALLSSLSGLPLRQGIAVTGAINQHGEMLPVGGVNEKIEGYFRSCVRLGLDGEQGVLIPHRNRRNLMLPADVAEAVAQGRFHVYTAERAGEGLALLADTPLGELGPQGYPADTVLGRAETTLRAYRRACEATAPAPRSRWPRGPRGHGAVPRRR